MCLCFRWDTDGSYPKYRRREGYEVYDEERKVWVTNQSVVPFNPYLLLRYECHNNIEAVSSIDACKYIYKYIHKGGDRLMGQQSIEGHDEIAEFQNWRYYLYFKHCCLI
jgi:hypothetical protein